uniref:G-protein coupled receptor n=1 Tax=Ascaris suum TaxID=6253 RepID=F1L5G0_ASCSU
MRTNRNVLIVNLALSNLMLALTNIPFLWLPSIDFEFLYSRFFCKFANALPGSNIYCSTLTISVMAIDRYYTVKKMYASSHRRQCLRAVCISILIWIISFLLSFPLLVYYDTTMLYVFKDVTVFSSGNATKLSSYGWRQCRLAPTQRKGMEDPNEAAKRESDAQKVQLFMSVMQALFLYVVPLIVLLIFNAKLTRFLQENSRQMHRSLSDGRSDDAGTLCIVKSSDLGQTAAVRNLPARRMNVRKRNRTTALLIAMAASYAVLWLPFTVVSMLLDLRILYMEGNGAAVIERIDQSCKMISIMSICVNPFLYGFLNTNFRHEFTDIFNQWICYKLRTPTNVQQEYSTIASPRRQSSSHSPQVSTSNRFLHLLQNPYVRRSSAPCSSFIRTSIARLT